MKMKNNFIPTVTEWARDMIFKLSEPLFRENYSRLTFSYFFRVVFLPITETIF